MNHRLRIPIAALSIVAGLAWPSSAPAKKPPRHHPRTSRVAARAAQKPKSPASPLSVNIGGAQFTPGGFLDFTSVWRSTNVGSGIGTAFGAIPFANTAAGNLSELHFSAQNSRLALKVTARPSNFNLTGYVEADFLGVLPANAYVSSNSNTLRMRLYWVDVRRGGWELLAGQTWSLLTPNRRGLSPLPADVFFTDDMDTNYQVGLVWGRIPELRLVRHINSHWTAGLALDSPDQYVGGAVTLPPTFASQLDNGANLATPNFAPDFIAKLAYDSSHNAPRLHLEAAGLLRAFRVNIATNLNSSKVGGGLELDGNLALTAGLHLIANSFYSDGGGRYIFGLGPDLVVNAYPLRLSLVHSASGIGGFEAQLTPHWLAYAYYGGTYFSRDYSASGRNANNSLDYVGYGYPGAALSANRAIQEFSAGLVHTFWSRPDYGAMQLISQYAYLWRNPWSPSAAAPRRAHANMLYLDLRYVLP